MLTKLSIKNYALIYELEVNFDTGFSVITGETGAGKSILLGALGLVLGKRADNSYLKDNAKKCIIEAQFDIKNYNLQQFFEDEDLDYESITIVRREILPSGKSRAFINDTPTTLNVLNTLSEKLIDVHSQHQTLSLTNVNYQFQIIDTLASNEKRLGIYRVKLKNHKKLNDELAVIIQNQQHSKEQYEYNLHLFNELEEANLKEREQEQIEKELSQLNNVEVIKSSLSEAIQLGTSEEIGITDLLYSFKNKLKQISTFSSQYEQLEKRSESLEIELSDIIQELEKANEDVYYNPSEIEKLNDRLQLIYDLLKKHSVATISELLEVQSALSEKVYAVEHSEKIVEEKQNEISKSAEELNKIADEIHQKRASVVPEFIQKIEKHTSELGMENARFKFNLQKSESFLSNGKDELALTFSANKGGNFGELKKIASGGELSRIMLSVKSILSNYMKLPTIIFDEIDTGVSGEISNKMGDIMKQMSGGMQVMSITHLPQIAAKGNHHFKVYKSEESEVVSTHLVSLTTEERIHEIAEMLGGKNLSESAVAHAKQLLN